jgi:hypothetical protein
MFKIIKYIEKKFTVSKNGTEKSMLSTRDVVILTDVIAKSALFSIKSLIIPFHSPFLRKISKNHEFNIILTSNKDFR